MKIKAKLIILFVVIKVIPLLMISYIAVIGANSLSDYFLTSTQSLFDESKKIISNTASTAIDDSIIALNKKSQTSMEILSYKVANSVATFLYERDKDILFLSRLSINQNILQEFYDAKHKQILEHGKYYYDEKKSLWVSSKNAKVSPRKITDALLKDNKKEFKYIVISEFGISNLKNRDLIDDNYFFSKVDNQDDLIETVIELTINELWD